MAGEVAQVLLMSGFLPRIPIWQAPCGSIAGPELCAAVSAAGGMGSMGLTWTSEPDVKAAIAHVKSLTSQPFFVNYALAFEPTTLPICLELGVPIISFSWGDASPFVPDVRASGAYLGIQVFDSESTKKAIDLGADFLVCQGVEAGGHVESKLPLEVALAEALEAAGAIPVIAAGGIGDLVGIQRVLGMGATGAMLGTRFVATQESRAHEEYKRSLVRATENSTSLSVCFDGGWPNAPHRTLVNHTLQSWIDAGEPTHGRPGEGEVIGWASDGGPIYRYEDTAPRIGFTGQISEMCQYAGTGVGFVQDVPSAGALIERLWSGAKAK